MRVNRIKRKNTEYYYIIKDINKNGSKTTKTVASLGSRETIQKSHPNIDPFEWAQKQANIMTTAAKNDFITIKPIYSSKEQLPLKTTTDGTFIKSPLKNIGYLFLQDIYYNLGLDKTMSSISQKYRFQYDLNEALTNLIYSRILHPASKRASLAYAQNFLESPNITIDQMYQSLSVLAKESDQIESTVYKNSLKVVPRNTKILYYDCTNFYFEIEQEDGIKKYGRSKENRPNPIVQMGLFIDGSGIPLAFTIDAGNTNEQTTLKPLEHRIMKDFGLSKFIVCTDAGLSSYANRRYNTMAERAYITTQSIKKLTNDLKNWALNPMGWHLPDDFKEYSLNEIDDSTSNHHIYYKECWIPESKNKPEERLIVTYSPIYKNYQRSIRERQINRAQKNAASPQSMKHKNANDPNRFIKEKHYTSDGEIADKAIYEIDENAVKKEAQYDGFYAVSTNLDSDASEIIKINHGRWEIEQCFRTMKHDFDSRPVFLQREDRIKAHFLICFLALLHFRILRSKVENTSVNQQYSGEAILSQLKLMNAEPIVGEGFIPKYYRTELTDILHQSFGFRTDTQAISKKKMKEILKQTKNR